MINHSELITKARYKMTVVKKIKKCTRKDKLGVLLCLLLAALLSTCQQVPEYCVKKAVYDPDCQFCFGDKAYDLCGGMRYNPLTQGCYKDSVVGTKCLLDNSVSYVVPFGTPCGYILTTAVIPMDGGDITNDHGYKVHKAESEDEVGLTASHEYEYEFVCWVEINTPATPEPAIKITQDTYQRIKMDRNRALAAIFKPIDADDTAEHKLITAVFPDNSGKLKFDVYPDRVTGLYNPGTTVTVTATANSGYKFVGWAGASDTTSPKVEIQMDAGKTLVAMFKSVEPALLKVGADPSDGGTVYVNGAALDGTVLMNLGTEIEAAAVPADGYAFEGWSEFADSTESTINVVIKKGLTLTAKFTEGTMPPPPPSPGRSGRQSR
jgi:uncharacterized repeat protein (TIGR02543 family)